MLNGKYWQGKQQSLDLNSYLNQLKGLYGGNTKQQSNDEVTALLESLAGIQDDQESKDDENLATMQSLFKVLAQVEEEKAKLMDSRSAKAQFLKGLGSALWNAGKNYLTDRYCPTSEGPTQN